MILLSLTMAAEMTWSVVEYVLPRHSSHHLVYMNSMAVPLALAPRSVELYLTNMGPVYSRSAKSSSSDVACSPSLISLASISARFFAKKERGLAARLTARPSVPGQTSLKPLEPRVLSTWRAFDHP